MIFGINTTHDITKLSQILLASCTVLDRKQHQQPVSSGKQSDRSGTKSFELLETNEDIRRHAGYQDAILYHLIFIFGPE